MPRLNKTQKPVTNRLNEWWECFNDQGSRATLRFNALNRLPNDAWNRCFISLDRLFFVIFFRLLWFSEPSLGIWDCNAVHGKWNSPRSIENHIEPFTSKPAAALLKLVYFSWKEPIWNWKVFRAHGIAIIRGEVSGVKGPQGEDTDHVSGR